MAITLLNQPTENIDAVQTLSRLKIFFILLSQEAMIVRLKSRSLHRVPHLLHHGVCARKVTGILQDRAQGLRVEEGQESQQQHQEFLHVWESELKILRFY